MRVLLDTCVISEIRRPEARTSVRDAVARLPEEDTYLSAITLGELASGVARLADGRRRRELAVWLDGLESTYAARILPVDAEVARLWGELDANARRIGRPVGVQDGLIAATARRHGLHVMTRNVDDFSPTGTLVVNPWED
ncbi:MAG: type II toxin-antitoxin system VapC family toxin [Gammaproteobacteria bacterium]|nr:type II toxin-antitoxin system VapC family toxin [Gammaproteobacteria bacterium]